MAPAGPPDGIADRYELGQVLGRGGMGEVRAGTDLALGREVAVKFLRRDLADQADLRRRFERERARPARITHPHVVAIYDIGEDDGLPYIVMERLSGRTLADEMGDGPLSQARACSLVLEILSGLEAAHRLHVLHRDIKPGNVLLDTDGHAKVADFGIAKLADDFDQTATGMLLGTVSYLAPERLAGDPATPASDLYSVGVLLFEALAGRPAFRADTPLALVASVSDGVAMPLDQVRDDLDPRVVATVERAMARDPGRRFDAAPTMAAALVAATHPAPAIADTPTVRVATGPAPRVPPTLPGRAVGPTSPGATPSVVPTEVQVDARSGSVPEGPTKSRWHSKPLVAALAGVLVVLVAAGLIAASVFSDDGQAPAQPGVAHDDDSDDDDAGHQPDPDAAPTRARRARSNGPIVNVRVRVVVVVVVLLAACGGSGSGISHSAEARLRTQVAAIRSAAGRTDRGGAARELARLLVIVDRLHAKGELDSDAAARIRRAAAAVRAQLTLIPLPTTTTTTTTTAPPSEDQNQDNGRGKGKKHDEGD